MGILYEFRNKKLHRQYEGGKMPISEELRIAPKKLKDDKEVVLSFVKLDGKAYYYASKRLQEDRDVILAAVQTCFGLLADLPEEYRDDKEIVLASVQKFGLTLRYASERLRKDPELREIAFSVNVYSLDFDKEDETKTEEETEI